jgi:hypothetical protein
MASEEESAETKTEDDYTPGKYEQDCKLYAILFKCTHSSAVWAGFVCIFGGLGGFVSNAEIPRSLQLLNNLQESEVRVW